MTILVLNVCFSKKYLSNYKTMKSIIQSLIFTLVPFFLSAQEEETWLITSQSFLGQKSEWESEYRWGEPIITNIRILVTDSKVTVYAQNTFIVRVIETVRYTEGFDAVFRGIDDEGVRCLIRIGTDRKSGEGFIAFEYSNLSLFYYAQRL